jgi:branched-chain amino acid transport system substrate-binding protein
MKFYLIPVVLVVVAAILASGCTAPASQNAGGQPGSHEIRVDALVDETGSLSVQGGEAKAALLLAESDINRYYQNLGSPTRVRVVIHDTGSNPATALAITKQLYANGTRMILGQQSSAELAAIKDFTDANGMLVWATGSTAHSLAIRNDSIFRLLSSDRAQGTVMGIMLAAQNMKAIVPVYRGDIWGDDLTNVTGQTFMANGGVTLEGVRYDPATRDFNATVSQLDIRAGQAIAKYGAGSTAIYAVTLGELGDIMNEAATKPNLTKVRWFGCDGNTGIPVLQGTSTAARFASDVTLTGTLWAAPLGMDYTAIQNGLGHEPDGATVALYDGLWITKDVLMDTQGSPMTRSGLAEALIRHTNTYSAGSGPMVLNAAGDRQLASYDIVRVVSGPTGSQWKKVNQIVIWQTGEIDVFSYPESTTRNDNFRSEDLKNIHTPISY